MNPYEVLGIPPNASQEDIKKAHRRLAKLHHPDRNLGNEDAAKKFKEIQAAYEFLSDDNKRYQHNQPEFFDDFFNNIFNFRFHEPNVRRRSVNVNVQLEVAIDFWESVHGCDKTITVPKFKTCDSCAGTGALEYETCSNCSGKGVIFQRQGFVTMESSCRQCLGTGRQTKKVCETCSSQAILRNDGTVTVKIPEGIQNNTMLRLMGQGSEFMGGIGDLHLVVKVNPHAVFKRHGDDLVYTLPITYSQAVLGITMQIPTIKDEVELVIPANTKNRTEFVFQGYGFKNVTINRYGRMIVLVEINSIDLNKVNDQYRYVIEQLAQLDQNNESEELRRFRNETKR